MNLARLVFIGFLVFLVNTVYLASTASPTIFYMANVLFHLGFGIVLAFLFISYFFKNSTTFSLPGKIATFLLLVGSMMGGVLIWTGAHRPFRWLLHAHIFVTAIGTLLMAFYLWKRLRPMGTAIGKFAGNGIVIAAIVALLVPAVVQSYHRKNNETESKIVNPSSPPLTMDGEGQGPEGPFFPSSAETSSGKTIPSNFFMTSEMCKRCHEDIFKQWFSSAHHFSSFNNQWYRKSIEYMQDVVGTKPSKWCGGCHDHAVIFNGMMDTPIKEIVNRPEAQAGLACTSCHSIVAVKSTMGQGDFVIEYPALHDLAVNENKYMQKLHDFLVFTDPEPHKKVFMKPFIRGDTAKFCSSCHKVHLDQPVNHYRWFRGFNEYDNWQASGVSGQGARAFYYPKKPMKCADCHMPLVNSNDPAAVDGKIHSHRFPGANTALPYVNRDQEQLDVTQKFLRDGQVSVDIFAISRGNSQEGRELKAAREPRISSTFAVGEESLEFGAASAFLREPAEVIAPINRTDAKLSRGDSVRLDVVVRTRKVGHFFPGGTVDAFDVWLELQAVDEKGQIIFWSGSVQDDGKGPVDPGAHFYRALLLDANGNRINKRNAWAARSVAYVRLIPPGAADTVHFRFRIPENCGEKIFLKAKLNYRKFSWWNTQFSFAGIRDPNQKDYSVTKDYDDGHFVFTGDTSNVSGKMKEIPNLPITVIAENEAVISIGENLSKPAEAKKDPSDRERWNDYGIGLLLQGDLKAAEAAFLKVTQIDPQYADGWVNIGRSRIQEGNIQGAHEVLQRALNIDPKLAKTHFFLGMVLKARGEYDAALKHFYEAAESYPLDRVVRNQIGRVLFLQRKYDQAVTELQRTLQIDPEDLQAHYNLMLCYRGLKNEEMAQKEEKLYLRFKADEASQEITGPFRRLNPEDNNERQPIHEHGSAS